MFRLFLTVLIAFSISHAHADEQLISLFPLEQYDQTLDTFIKPGSPDYDKPLLSAEVQKQHLALFHKKYFLPWDPDYVNHILLQESPDDIKTIEKEVIRNFSNSNKTGSGIGYGENFRPYADHWIRSIKENINPDELTHLRFQKNNRAITIDNLHARSLPTEEVHFYSHQLAGQGFPFDNLQMSSIWAGTPVYIIAESKDHAWSLILTPDYIAWVKSSGLARVSDTFITQWETQAKKQLAAITLTQTSVLDETGHYLFSAYVGSVFPAVEIDHTIKLMVPIADENHQAVIKTAIVAKEAASLVPLTLTPHHLASIMKTLLNRPYGWGNLYFYNDCSAELKNLFTPFAIWLPRHSAEQVLVGKMVDLSSATAIERLAYLMHFGKKLITLVYIGNHVFLYIGNHPNQATHSEIAITYQNVWGLKPNPTLPSRRAVIGQSVLFPLLLQYPEDTTLQSQADYKYFQVSFLDELPPDATASSIKFDLHTYFESDLFK